MAVWNIGFLWKFESIYDSEMATFMMEISDNFEQNRGSKVPQLNTNKWEKSRQRRYGENLCFY